MSIYNDIDDFFYSSELYDIADFEKYHINFCKFSPYSCRENLVEIEESIFCA